MAVIRRWAHGALICLLPCLVALYVAGTAYGGRLFPWRANMADLRVYMRAGYALRTGGDIYQLPDSLPFIYPPFAAVLAVPLSYLPLGLVQIGWSIAVALVLVAIFHRLGLAGWPLSLISAATLRFFEPLNQTLAFGQVGVFLVGLVLLDLAPGPRIFTPHRRRLPLGIGVGLATTIKLTPGLFVVYLLVIRRFRAVIVATVTVIVTTAIGFLVTPRLSIDFWGRLLHGDTGLGDSIIYLPNQSLFGVLSRILGYNTVGNAIGLVLAAAVAVLGVVVAARWYRAGDQQMAIVLCGLATLLASPVSWSHHFVWIAPLAVLLVVRDSWPPWFRTLGLLFVGWVVAAPWKFLPNGGGEEAGYNVWQNGFASLGPALGCVLLVAALIVVDRSKDMTIVAGDR